MSLFAALLRQPIVSALAAATALLHLLAARGYGIFRDELYYVACGEHLSFGYVDHPPLVAVGAWLVTHLLGTSLFALRLLPALAAGILVLLAVALARQFGGGRFAQFLAGLCVALAPIYLGLCSVYSMNAFDLVVWSAILLLVAKLLDGGKPRLWWLCGALIGLGLQNKLSVFFLCFGLVAGLLLAGRWRLLRARDPWIGAGIALLAFAPHLVWQMLHDWPTREFVRNASQTKNLAMQPLEFLSEQLLNLNPLTLPLWLGGLAMLLFARRWRALGICYLAILSLMLGQNAKPYYLAPIYPLLLAAGCVALEARSGRIVRGVAITLVGLSGLALAPLAKPLLPVDDYVAYASALGIAPSTDERKEVGRLPQFFADMHGWRELAATVARVYAELPVEQRAEACVYAQNYGEAGAIDFFAREFELPPAISGHNSYWLWGPADCSGATMLIIGGRESDHLRSFEAVRAGGVFECTDCMPYENGSTIWVCRGLRAPIAESWPRVKHYD